MNSIGTLYTFDWSLVCVFIAIQGEGGGGNPHPFYLRPAEDVTTWDLQHALSPMCLTLTCFAFRKNVLICIGNISLKIVFISFRQRQAGTIGFN